MRWRQLDDCRRFSVVLQLLAFISFGGENTPERALYFCLYTFLDSVCHPSTFYSKHLAGFSSV